MQPVPYCSVLFAPVCGLHAVIAQESVVVALLCMMDEESPRSSNPFNFSLQQLELSVVVGPHNDLGMIDAGKGGQSGDSRDKALDELCRVGHVSRG